MVVAQTSKRIFELVAVPRADEMHLVGEGLPLIGAVLGDHVDHPVDHQALAGRPAGMDAVVAVGEVGAVLAEHADFRLSRDHDPPVAVLHLGRLGNEAFGHELAPLRRSYHADMRPLRPLRHGCTASRIRKKTN